MPAPVLSVTTTNAITTTVPVPTITTTAGYTSTTTARYTSTTTAGYTSTTSNSATTTQYHSSSTTSVATSSLTSTRSSSTITSTITGTTTSTLTSSSSSSTLASSSKSSSSSSSSATATPPPNYPGRRFTPYTDILAIPYIDLASIQSSIGLNYFTLSFIGACSNGNPCWGSYDALPVDPNNLYFGSQISAIRAKGGDIVLSFGGASIVELATVAADAASLAAKYQLCITAYKANAIDFDLEGDLVNNGPANDLRSQALAILKKNNPNLKIGLSLPCTPNGLVSSGVAILQSAKTFGLSYDCKRIVNLVLNCMAFDFGSYFAQAGTTPMGAYAIQALGGINTQGAQAGLSNFKAGIIVSIGVDDVPGEIFSFDDANMVIQFAQQNSWVGLVSFWSLNRDNSASSQVTQTPYQYSKAFLALNA
ncbi:hypothetical protein HDV01_007888 [Terramyces sp. JEL0728]|nr:hypothetical protein HDV01_007888 [Terramyces sp. JEL0728]